MCIRDRVAWAHEGLARVHMKDGSLDEALQHVEEALRIRTLLQETSQGMELFEQEIQTSRLMHASILKTRAMRAEGTRDRV